MAVDLENVTNLVALVHAYQALLVKNAMIVSMVDMVTTVTCRVLQDVNLEAVIRLTLHANAYPALMDLGVIDVFLESLEKIAAKTVQMAAEVRLVIILMGVVTK